MHMWQLASGWLVGERINKGKGRFKKKWKGSAKKEDAITTATFFMIIMHMFLVHVHA